MSTSYRELQERFVLAMTKVEAPRILEAGCGSLSRLEFPRDAHVTGIDISQQQLERNTIAREKICADLQNYNFPPGSFDAIVCWEVLEHLPHPNSALERFASALKTGGILVLALPHVRSLKGWITKLTPHWFHVWVYRAILGNREAGKNGRAPFQTYLRASIAPEALRAWSKTAGLQEEYSLLYRGNLVGRIENRSAAVKLLWRVMTIVVKGVSLGKIDTANTDVVFVFKKE